MTNPMIEKAALVIADREVRRHLGPPPEPDKRPIGINHDAWERSREMISRRPETLEIIHAVLRAIREPSEEMSEHMNEHEINGMVNWRDIMNAYFDKLLEEGR